MTDGYALSTDQQDKLDSNKNDDNQFSDIVDPWWNVGKNENKNWFGRRAVRIAAFLFVFVLWSGLSFGFYFNAWIRATDAYVNVWFNDELSDYLSDQKNYGCLGYIGLGIFFVIGLGGILYILLANNVGQFIKFGSNLFVANVFWFSSFMIGMNAVDKSYKAIWKLSDSNEKERDSARINIFITGFFPFFTAFLIMLDSCCHIMKNVHIRHFLLNLNLIFTSLMFIISAQIVTESESFSNTKQSKKDNINLYKTGFMIIGSTCVFFLIFCIIRSLFRCSSKKINIIILVSIVISLLTGSIVASVGYFNSFSTLNETIKTYNNERIVGFIFFLFGYVIILSGDIIDDFLGAPKTTKENEQRCDKIIICK